MTDLYEYSGNTKKLGMWEVHEIKALKTFTAANGQKVNAGDLGGYVFPETLDKRDNTGSWVFPGSMALGTSRLQYGAVLTGGAVVADTIVNNTVVDGKINASRCDFKTAKITGAGKLKSMRIWNTEYEVGTKLTESSNFETFGLAIEELDIEADGDFRDQLDKVIDKAFRIAGNDDLYIAQAMNIAAERNPAAIEKELKKLKAPSNLSAVYAEAMKLFNEGKFR